MKKSNKINKQVIIENYMQHVLDNNEPPTSVYKFSTAYSFEEALFYSFFGSFEAVEKEIFSVFYANTINALEKSEDYPKFEARNKLLSFYYTFFENLSANRSFILLVLKRHENGLKTLPVLSELKSNFINYIESIGIEMIDLKEQKIAQLQQKSLKESAWLQLLITLKFWMNDTSASFEKTDVFIEKSINASFDILNIKPLKSIIDFGKFLYKENLNCKI